MLNYILPLAKVASWLLLPAIIIAIVDDWFLRPQRRLAALPAAAQDPAWLSLVYGLLPFLLVGGAVRLFLSERLDFSLVLVLASAVGAVIWALDSWVLRPARSRAAVAVGRQPSEVLEPGTVENARTMVPVVVVVLLLRSFLFEPFRIPSDSMMPTLQAGDFILVNKFAYGLRLPVLGTKIFGVREPERGDVVVFHYPPDPAVNYIKRVVGLPGDRIKVISDRIYVNGVPLEQKDLDPYSDGCYQDMGVPQLPSCNRSGMSSNYSCSQAQAAYPDASGMRDSGDYAEVTVPEGHYMMIGDNRDNSSDSRFWGFVPEANLVGSAKRVWLNVDFNRRPKITWGRFGKRID